MSWCSTLETFTLSPSCTTSSPSISNLHHKLLPFSKSNHRTFLPLKRSSLFLSLPALRYNSSSVLRATTSEETSSGGNQCFGEEREGVITLEDKSLPENNVYNETLPNEVSKEESPNDGETQGFELLDELNMKVSILYLPHQRELSQSLIFSEKRTGDKSCASYTLSSGLSSSVAGLKAVIDLLVDKKFDSEDTLSILLYGSGALVAVWLASAIVGAIDSIPVFPKLMEVVGLAYTFWFGTRYLLFKKNREELTAKIEEIKREVLGSDD